MGYVSAATPSNAGRNAQLASTLRVPGGKVFIKGLPSSHRNVFTQNNEARVGPSLHGISPSVLHHCDAGGWNVLVFEQFAGRPADLAPGSPDLTMIASTLHKLLSGMEHDTSVSLPIEKRWAHLGRDLNLHLLAGDDLVHTDMNRENILIGATQSVLVDWALPGRGAPWLNAAFMISSLVSEGHFPRAAERWACQSFEVWRETDPSAIDTFVKALVRRREEQAKKCPEPQKAQRRRFARRAQLWHTCREEDRTRCR